MNKTPTIVITTDKFGETTQYTFEDCGNNINMYATGNMWTTKYKGSKILSVINTGNGIDIHMGNKHLELDYGEIEYLFLALEYLYNNSDFVSKIEIEKFKKI